MESQRPTEDDLRTFRRLRRGLEQISDRPLEPAVIEVLATFVVAWPSVGPRPTAAPGPGGRRQRLPQAKRRLVVELVLGGASHREAAGQAQISQSAATRIVHAHRRALAETTRQAA